jgi:neurotrimin
LHFAYSTIFLCDLQMGYLEVVIPPDILSEESSEDGVALEGSNLQMKCKATGLPDPTVVWRREDSKNIILRADGSRDKQGKILILIVHLKLILTC